MTKQQARVVYLAGAGLAEADIQIAAGNIPPTGRDITSLDRMHHCARFEHWWKHSKSFSRAKEGGR
jgi:hypothetical protein